MSLSERDALLALPSIKLAPLLLGAHVSTFIDGQLVVVRLTEVEAYAGAEDPGSHAYRGRTSRNAGLFGPPGTAYVYFTYGMHHCANVVCGAEGTASGVLLRAGEVLVGRTTVLARRRFPVGPEAKLLSGPARLAQGLGMSLKQNLGVYAPGTANAGGAELGLDQVGSSQATYLSGPRTGVAGPGGGDEYPFRFWLPDEASVSAYRKAVSRKRVGRED